MSSIRMNFPPGGFVIVFFIGFIMGQLQTSMTNMAMWYVPQFQQLVQTGIDVEKEDHADGSISSSSSNSSREHNNFLVEDVMYKYGSDKSRDDHGYSKLYEMILGPIRESIKNFTEIGIAAGQSIQAWHRYLPSAEIHGFDPVLHDKVRDNLAALGSRVHLHVANILENNGTLSNLGFVPESMDVIIEDGPHSLSSQQQFLVNLFPYLKPGGIYIIEDVGYMQGGYTFHEKPEELAEPVRKILEEHDTVWVDTGGIGHRAWDQWQRAVGKKWAADRTNHNSILVVIQKRKKPLRPLQMNYGSKAMKVDEIVLESKQNQTE